VTSSEAESRVQLTADERRGVVVAAESAFLKLANLYDELLPIFSRYGFKPPSAGVVSRDVSEQLEEQIILHCKTFTRGSGFTDLARHGERWEVKICKGKGLTINQNAQIRGENYIVVNYSDYSSLRCVWVLWHAEDRFFKPRKANLNLRTILRDEAVANIELIYEAPREQRMPRSAKPSPSLRMAKAEMPIQLRKRSAR
jgi:hypothetical protein